MGLPTLFLPNMNTGMDDQLARCNVAEEEGWGFVSENNDLNLVNDLLSLMHEVPENTENGSSMLAMALLNG